jgi:hypothetical protein
MASTIGTRIGAYEISNSLDAGGMGEVYRARDTRLNRAVLTNVNRAAVRPVARREAIPDRNDDRDIGLPIVIISNRQFGPLRNLR